MRKIRPPQNRGATLIELLLVMAIIGIFTRLISLNLFRGQQRASLTVSRDVLISDLRKQQQKAMQGDTETAGELFDYSVRFEENRYILYAGVVYDELNESNVVVTLDPILQFTPIDLPGSTLTFARLSGDVREYDPVLHMVTLTNVQTANTYRLSFNERGVPFIE